MGVYKDKNRGNWYVSYRYVDSFGNRKRKYHRGFRTRAEAQAWEREDRLKEEFSTSMTLGKFYELYEKDVKHRVKENTWNNKEYIVKSKILPYFGEMPLSQITPRTIRHWQNEIMQEVDENGRKHKPSYLATIHTQLSCILNHAVRFYGLKTNVARMAGGMGTKEHCEMLFWTQDEYKKFIKSVMDKPKSYYGFELLYWCGLRIGDDDDKIRLNQRKPSKYKGLSRFGPEKNLQRINKFMKERPTFYKKLIQMKENFRFYLRCFYCITKVVILQFNSEKQDRISS